MNFARGPLELQTVELAALLQRGDALDALNPLAADVAVVVVHQPMSVLPWLHARHARSVQVYRNVVRHQVCLRT